MVTPSHRNSVRSPGSNPAAERQASQSSFLEVRRNECHRAGIYANLLERLALDHLRLRRINLEHPHRGIVRQPEGAGVETRTEDDKLRDVG
jgi:hypothetical protein